MAQTPAPATSTLQQKQGKLHEPSPSHPLHCQVSRYPRPSAREVQKHQCPGLFALPSRNIWPYFPLWNPKTATAPAASAPGGEHFQNALPQSEQEVRQTRAAIAQLWDAVCSWVCASTRCWLLTDPTAALSISRDAQTAAGHKQGSASCSPGQLHLVQTQGHSPIWWDEPTLGCLSARTSLSQK